MARANVRRRHSDLPHFESVTRISSFPIVESGIHIAGNVYRKIKVQLPITLYTIWYIVCRAIKTAIKTDKSRFQFK